MLHTLSLSNKISFYSRSLSPRHGVWRHLLLLKVLFMFLLVKTIVVRRSSPTAGLGHANAASSS